MTFESFRTYCLSKPATTEDYPFDGTSAWIKVAGKLFALANVMEMKMGKEEIPPFHFINLKCDPERAVELREEYEAIQPGWHMNKKHWNSVYLNHGLRDSFIKELIDHSYNIVVASLPKKTREELQKNLK
ncbi:MAG: MmcQ/YjbR family DNA-binding protein [Flavipsychrobacter sp.]